MSDVPLDTEVQMQKVRHHTALYRAVQRCYIRATADAVTCTVWLHLSGALPRVTGRHQALYHPLPPSSLAAGPLLEEAAVWPRRLGCGIRERLHHRPVLAVPATHQQQKQDKQKDQQRPAQVL